MDAFCIHDYYARTPKSTITLKWNFHTRSQEQHLASEIRALYPWKKVRSASRRHLFAWNRRRNSGRRALFPGK